MNLSDCHNVEDFRKLAKKKLPSPIFHYIDGGSDDETTLKRNTESFLKCDLVPNILAGVGEPDLSTTVFGQKIEMGKKELKQTKMGKNRQKWEQIKWIKYNKIFSRFLEISC